MLEDQFLIPEPVVVRLPLAGREALVVLPCFGGVALGHGLVGAGFCALRRPALAAKAVFRRRRREGRAGEDE